MTLICHMMASDLDLNSSKRAINRTARKIDDRNDVTQLAIRTHAALISYFDGKDVTGKIHGPKIDHYAAFIIILRGEGSKEFAAISRGADSRAGIREHCERTFKSVGLTGAGGRLALPARDDYRTLPESSIGPLLPGILGVLKEEHNIDSTVAVREHRADAVDSI